MRCEMCNRGEVNTKFRSRAEETITVLGSQRMAYSLPFSRRFRVNEINGSVYVGARIHCVADCILPMALIDKRNFFPNFTLFLSLVRTDHLFWNSPWICSVGMKRWQSCIAHSLIRSLAHTYAPPNKQQTLLHHNWIHRVGAQIKVIKAISLCVCVCLGCSCDCQWALPLLFYRRLSSTRSFVQSFILNVGHFVKCKRTGRENGNKIAKKKRK